LDPQGNASTGLGLTQAQRKFTSYNLLIGNKFIPDVEQKTSIPYLSVVPSNIDLSGAEIELVGLPQREFRLKHNLTQSEVDYDYVIIDCPPSLGLITINALVACDTVLIPLQCEFYALEGLSHLLKTIKIVKSKLNPTLEIQGVILTMYDRRNRLTSQIESDVRDFMGDVVFDTVIPRNVRMSEAPSHGLPALLYDMNCKGSQAYLYLAKELLKRESFHGPQSSVA
jgi:chromosome partitioning protein